MTAQVPDGAAEGEIVALEIGPEPDEDNRLLADHLLHGLMEFNYGGYGADDFPAFDPEEGGPSELLRDLALDLTKVVGGYFAARAETFRRAGDPTSVMIAQVIQNLSDEIGNVMRADGLHSHEEGAHVHD